MFMRCLPVLIGVVVACLCRGSKVVHRLVALQPGVCPAVGDGVSEPRSPRLSSLEVELLAPVHLSDRTPDGRVPVEDVVRVGCAGGEAVARPARGTGPVPVAVRQVRVGWYGADERQGEDGRDRASGPAGEELTS